MRTLLRSISGAASALILLTVSGGPAIPPATAGVPSATASVPSATASVPDDGWPRWRWPVAGVRSVVNPYRAPAHRYGAGHRGVDLGAAIGAVVVAPAPGVVAFRGTVVDRALLTIAHDDGLVSTFEPLSSTLQPGQLVAAGQEIGRVDVGGHTSPGALHVGVRRDGAYINPMLLFDDVPRAVLLPCCESF
ncbi:peptidoglycan DD-metalloendopeptidase family protein [Microbacterium algeriense]|uniref:M23 family metallopeptidase n=1 Tax=Microbacterium algeriense TaxID=2615184 RepID=UPI000309A5EE|nr:peptidoglycan DD-metalloendopeptidase family protein [Microbacterium barkeri]